MNEPPSRPPAPGACRRERGGWSRPAGLELVELVRAVEESFGIEIPDGDAQRIRTPNQLVDDLALRLAAREGGLCHSQIAFHRVRRGLEAEGPASARELRSRSPRAP